MRRKISKSVGKIMLAGSIGLTGAVANLSFPEHQTYAEQPAKQVDYEKMAKEFLVFAKANNWESAYSQLSPTLKSYVSKEVLAQLWTSLTSQFGTVQDHQLKEVKNDGVHTKVSFTCTAEQGAYELVLKYNRDGQLDEFLINPAYPPNSFLNPKYHHPEKYTEKQIVIGEGAFSLPGILTVPKGKGPFPVVVLVHGSGPNDMDETAYSFKPFRDIAVGLVNEGIAVFRYDKRTNAHAIKSSLTPKFSIQEETVIDANLAVEKLKSFPEIDPKNIFVLGHSQGAFALPLILENDKTKNIKGAIAVAGPAGKFQDLLLWQMEQLVERAEKMNAPKEQIEALKENLKFYQEQFALLNDPKYSKDNIPPSFKLQNPYWWYDIRDFVPTELAKRQDVPLFILQGGKDIQVPPSEFDNWKSALKDQKNVQYKLYPDMMHMLANYPGEPNGQTEYMTPGNVPEEFLSDISNWIKKEAGDRGNGFDPTEYKDYKPNQYWSEAFTWAINEGIIKGFVGEKLLKPHNPMTESQYLNVFFRYTLGENFKDESLKNVYTLAREYHLPVKNKPNAALSRGEAALLLVSSFTDENMTEKEAVQWLYDHHIVKGYIDKNGNAPKTYESFKPNAAMTRAHLVTFLYRIHEKGLADER